MRRDVAQALEDGEREIRRRNLEREVLADEPGQLLLVVERVDAGGDAARAVAEQEDGQARLPRLRESHEGPDVAGVVVERLDEEALAFRSASAAQVHRVDRETARDELLGHPAVVAAVRIEPRDDRDDAPGLRRGAPRPHEELEALRRLQGLLVHAGHQGLCHRVSPLRR